MTNTLITILIILFSIVAIVLFIFWITQLIDSAKKKRWLWFTMMLILGLISYIGGIITATIYYIIKKK